MITASLYCHCSHLHVTYTRFPLPIGPLAEVEGTNTKEKRKVCFYLMMSLEHIDFHIIGYWTSLCHISLEETRYRQIGYSFG